MEYRKFGNTDLLVSVIGFGAWGIGGPAMAGTTPIGWGTVDDDVSLHALQQSRELGITFYDTADFYGLGRSEELIGRAFGNRPDVVVATKVGHRLGEERGIVLDYSRRHIIQACEASLKRLRRERIDFYQLHSAKVAHLQTGEPVEAMQQLQRDGKIRFWGVSLNTFHPGPEVEFLLDRRLGHGFQVVLNILNQRALPFVKKAAESGYGIIARMPLQFGLLTGKFTSATRFAPDDHRSFRLPPAFLERAEGVLPEVWAVAERLKIDPVRLAIGFCTSIAEVSTVIPGIRTADQARQNAAAVCPISGEARAELERLYRDRLFPLVEFMERLG